MKTWKLILCAWRSPFAVALFMAGLASLAGNTAQAATIPIAITTCACTSLAQLRAAATAYGGTWLGRTPPGYVGTIQNSTGTTGHTGATTLLVASTSAPISNTYWWGPGSPHGDGPVIHSDDASTDLGTIAVDAAYLSRAANTGPIVLPPGYSIENDTGEAISAWLGNTGLQIIGTGVSPWHALFGSFQYAIFKVNATNQTFKVWAGDSIKVEDADDWSELFVYDATLSIHWKENLASKRDANGNPVGTSNVTGSPATRQPGGGIVIHYPSGPPVIVVPYYGGTNTGVITVQDYVAPSAHCVDGHCH